MFLKCLKPVSQPLLRLCVCWGTPSTLAVYNSAFAFTRQNVFSRISRSARDERLGPFLGMHKALNMCMAIWNPRNLLELFNAPYEHHSQIFLLNCLSQQVSLPQAAVTLNSCHGFFQQMPWVRSGNTSSINEAFPKSFQTGQIVTILWQQGFIRSLKHSTNSTGC